MQGMRKVVVLMVILLVNMYGNIEGPTYGLSTKEYFTVICNDDNMSWIETVA